MTNPDAKLFFNGPILTMDAQNPECEAVLTRGGQIAAVGSEADLRARMPADTQEVDLQGQTLMPAFIDPHGHFPDSGFVELFRVDLSAPPRGDCLDIPTALRRLANRARQTPKGEWIMGVLFDNTAIADRRMPTRAELDAVSRDHPVWVIHASGHNGVANSAALSFLGADANTPDPVGGRFDRDPETGELTGLIEGLSAMGPLGETCFLIDRVRFLQGCAAARDEYLQHGVTFAQNAWVNAELLEHFAALAAQGDPGIGLMLLPIAELEPALSEGRAEVDWQDTPHVRTGPRKLFSDGSFQLQTAFLSEPYHEVRKSDCPNGMPYMDPDLFRSEVIRLHRLGFQVHCHCNGDAGAEMFIDAVEAALLDTPCDDHRHTVIHGQVLRDDQLRRMARLGMTVSFFSAHVHFWGDRHYDTIMGPARANRLTPAGSAGRFGVRFTLHNDASVTPTRPLHLAHCAVNRVTASGRLLGADQRVSVMSALRAQTIDAAWQVFLEDERGSLEPGKMADLAVLSQNPLLAPERLKEISVTRTYRCGKLVFERDKASEPHTDMQPLEAK